MELLLSFAYIALFVFLIGKMKFFRIEGISVNTIKAGYLIKILAGVSVGLIYTYYYTDRLTADTFKFFDDSKILFGAVYSKPYDFFRMLTGINSGAPELQPYYDKMTNWYDTFSPYNDNRTMIRLNAFLRFFSLGYYYVHVVFVCFLSLCGIVAIVKMCKREFPEFTLVFFLTFLLLPSVLFWGSGLLKDSLVFFTLGFVLYWFDKFIHEKKYQWYSFILILCFLFLLMISKFHVFLLVIPLLTAWWVSVKYKIPPFGAFMGSQILFLGIIVLLPYYSKSLDLSILLSHKQEAFYKLASESNAGSLIKIPLLEPSFISIILNAPHGFLTCLARPFITDTGSFLIIIAALENFFILLFGIYALIKFKIASVKGKILPFFCLFYTVTFFVLIGLVTPVMGAIVRYKAQALPFLVVFYITVLQLPLKNMIRKLLIRYKS